MKTKTIFKAFFLITILVSYAYPSLSKEDVADEPLVNHDPEFDTLDTISPASDDYDNHILENLPPKYKTYIETCMDKMGYNGIEKCGDDILKEIIKNEPVSRECCLEVVKAGKECHVEMYKLAFQMYQLKRFTSQVSFKINEVWNRCSAEVESLSSSHDDKI